MSERKVFCLSISAAFFVMLLTSPLVSSGGFYNFTAVAQEGDANGANGKLNAADQAGLSESVDQANRETAQVDQKAVDEKLKADQGANLSKEMEDQIINGMAEADGAIATQNAKASTAQNRADSIISTAISTMAETPSVLASSSSVDRSSPEQAVTTWEFGADINIPPTVVGGAFEAETDIISSEVNTGTLVAAYSDFSAGPNHSRLATSTTNGLTWVDKGSMIIPVGTSFHSDPVLATNSKGNFIATTLAFDGDSSAIQMQVSGTGAVWGPTVTVAGSTGVNAPAFYDKEWIASDPNVHSPFKDRTYMCYTLFDSPLGTSKIMVKRIQNPLDAGNGILLASAGVATSNVVQGCNVAVGPNGQVAVAWYQASPASPTTAKIMVSRSYNGGVTWTVPVSFATVTKLAPCFAGFYGCMTGTAGPFRVNQFPDITWDRLGGLHATFVSFHPIFGPEIYYTWSSTCGTPTGACTLVILPTFVNSDAAFRDQFFPNIIVTDEVSTTTGRGVVHIVAQDKRESATNTSWRPWSYHCDATVTTCTFPGWLPAAHPQVPVAFALFSNSASFSTFVGDYNGLTTGNGVTTTTSREGYSIWFDNFGIVGIWTDRTTT